MENKYTWFENASASLPLTGNFQFVATVAGDSP